MLGPLPEVRVPQHEQVIWNMSSASEDPTKWGAQRLAAWFCKFGATIFKVGIAADPRKRFFDKEIGYVLEDRWHFTDVIWKGPAYKVP